MTLTPMDLIGQFILCKSRDAIPEGWNVRQHGKWYLSSHPTLPVTDILAADSSRIGWLLGWAISSGGCLVEEFVHFDVAPNDDGVADHFESCLYEYGGRFAGVCLLEKSLRFYLDPIGSLAAVYCPQQMIVASTPTLVPRSSDTEEDFQLIQQMGIPESLTCWCPFGTTPRRNVERVLPNHFLNLQTWKTIRHWPKGDIHVTTDVSSAVEELVVLLKRNISALAQEHLLYMPLTAGRDSRMLLACARSHVERITFFTYGHPDGHRRELARRERQISGHIVSTVGLEHVFLPFQEPSQVELDEWLYRIGNCEGGLYSRLLHVYTRLDHGRPVLHGAAGELGRGFHWRKDDTEASRISPRDLLHKRQIPVTPALEKRAGQWLDCLPVSNTLTIWGLLYNEEFNGCWMSPGFYGDALSNFIICPFSHRRLIQIMLALPTDYRRSNCLPMDVIRKEWPELSEIPFNWPMGIRRYLHAIQWRFRRLISRIRSREELR